VSDGLAVTAGVLLGLLYLAFYLGIRHKEVREGWSRRAEEGWSWKLLIPPPERPWMAWAIFGIYGLLAVMWFLQGAFWIAIPTAVLCLISFAQGLWGQPLEDA
jgi:multisubunit Na+/H+ antiporter MnhB subunit